MAVIQGSLLKAMESQARLGVTVGVVVVDEQSDHGTGGYDETESQQTVLMYASRMGLRV